MNITKARIAVGTVVLAVAIGGAAIVAQARSSGNDPVPPPWVDPVTNKVDLSKAPKTVPVVGQDGRPVLGPDGKQVRVPFDVGPPDSVPANPNVSVDQSKQYPTEQVNQ
jgi:hypothetical protein